MPEIEPQAFGDREGLGTSDDGSWLYFTLSSEPDTQTQIIFDPLSSDTSYNFVYRETTKGPYQLNMRMPKASEMLTFLATVIKVHPNYPFMDVLKHVSTYIVEREAMELETEAKELRTRLKEIKQPEED